MKWKNFALGAVLATAEGIKDDSTTKFCDTRDDLINLDGNGDSCRFRIRPESREESQRIKLRLYETTTYGSCESLDKIYLQTESAKYGPYCVGPSDRVKRRKRKSVDNNLVLSSYSPHFESSAVDYDEAVDDARSDVVNAMAQQLIEENTALELSEDEMEEVDGIFASDAMDVIYVTAPGGYKFRFKFNFEWELIEMPGAMTEVNGIYYPTQAATHDVWGIPFQYDAVCQVSQFQPQAQAIFNDQVENIAKGKDMNDLDMNDYGNY